MGLEVHLADLEGAHDSICNLEKMEDPLPATQSFIGDSFIILPGEGARQVLYK